MHINELVSNVIPRPLANPMGGGGCFHGRAPLGVQILSFPCSFQEKICNNNRLAHPLWELASPSGKSVIRHCQQRAQIFEVLFLTPGCPKSHDVVFLLDTSGSIGAGPGTYLLSLRPSPSTSYMERDRRPTSSRRPSPRTSYMDSASGTTEPESDS